MSLQSHKHYELADCESTVLEGEKSLWGGGVLVHLNRMIILAMAFAFGLCLSVGASYQTTPGALFSTGVHDLRLYGLNENMTVIGTASVFTNT